MAKSVEEALVFDSILFRNRVYFPKLLALVVNEVKITKDTYAMIVLLTIGFNFFN